MNGVTICIVTAVLIILVDASPAFDRNDLSFEDAQLHPVFSPQYADTNKPKIARDLALFLSLNGAHKNAIIDQHVHTSDCPAGRVDAQLADDDTISRMLGQYLLNALKQQAAGAEQKSNDEPVEPIDDDPPQQQVDDQHNDDDHAADDDQHDDDVKDNHDEDIDDPKTRMNLASDHVNADDDKEPPQPHDDAQPEPEAGDAKDPVIAKIRDLLRNAFGIECNCSVVPPKETDNSSVVASDAQTEQSTTTTTTTPAPPTKRPTNVLSINQQQLRVQLQRAFADALAKLSNSSAVVQTVNLQGPRRVQNQVNIQLDQNARDQPTRVQLNTDAAANGGNNDATGDGIIPPMVNYSGDRQPTHKTTARSVGKSNGKATHALHLDDGLQFFRDQQRRFARPTKPAIRQPPPQQRRKPRRPAPAAATRAGRARTQQQSGAAGGAGAGAAVRGLAAAERGAPKPLQLLATDRNAIGSVVNNANAVQPKRRQRGAYGAVDDDDDGDTEEVWPSGDGASAADDRTRETVSVDVSRPAGSRSAEDSADVLLKQFLGLYERYKRSQQQQVMDDSSFE